MTKSSSKKKASKRGQRGIPHSRKETSPQNLRRNLKRARVLELRLEGLTYKEIAEETGLSIDVVGNYVKRSARAAKQAVKDRAHLLVAIQDFRLEQGYERLEKVAKKKEIEVKDVIAATEGQRKINESRRKLYGVDQAQKMSVETSGVPQHDLSRLSDEEVALWLKLTEKTQISAGDDEDE